MNGLITLILDFFKSEAIAKVLQGLWACLKAGGRGFKSGLTNKKETTSGSIKTNSSDKQQD